MDTVYEPVRIKPDVVAPMGTTSVATPAGASAVALLMDAEEGMPNAGKAEVIRAALMAGADRITDCQCDGDYIGDYRAEEADYADNGLDKRFGAGQINIHTAYHIIAAGEQDSGSTIAAYGFDYNPAFGGLEGSSDTALYYFSGDAEHSRVSVALVWHVAIDGGRPELFNGDAVYYDMDLVLYEEFSIWLNSCEDSDEDGLPNLVDPDADNDLINDGPEYEYWGEEWDGDVDEDGLYNLVDPDSDDDGYSDGTEIARGSDPSDPTSHPMLLRRWGLPVLSRSCYWPSG
ncbi:MAG: hypothetical protein SWH61_12230 [Thermodesulfobacteriota bacterium]|nr:hypothetical protein [Thermodesulfobacteriota bacterium]